MLLLRACPPRVCEVDGVGDRRRLQTDPEAVQQARPLAAAVADRYRWTDGPNVCRAACMFVGCVGGRSKYMLHVVYESIYRVGKGMEQRMKNIQGSLPPTQQLRLSSSVSAATASIDSGYACAQPGKIQPADSHVQRMPIDRSIDWLAWGSGALHSHARHSRLLLVFADDLSDREPLYYSVRSCICFFRRPRGTGGWCSNLEIDQSTRYQHRSDVDRLIQSPDRSIAWRHLDRPVRSRDRRVG